MNAPLSIAVLGAGSIGSLFAAKLAGAGHDVTMIVRNEARRAYLREHGLVTRSRLTGRVDTVRVGLEPALRHTYDLVLVAVQRPHIDALVPTLAANDSRAIMLMFNCASGADQWAGDLGADRLLWGFPAVLADLQDQVLEYAVVPAALRFVQITTIGTLDGRETPTLTAVREAFGGAGIPTTVDADIDAWLKTHAAYMAPIMAMGYVPPPGRFGPRLRWSDARALAAAMRTAFAAIRATGVGLTPGNMRFLDRLPAAALTGLLWTVFWSPMAKRSLSSHSGAAPGEVAMLLAELEFLALGAGVDPTPLRALAVQVPTDA
ncbi:MULTISPECIES: ketopantoate reductase family protein [unclassified Nocardia]|uniref:ketopantoate reductase family protein n=1 Tax=unclassified Nocardia TaxID=2637762 RepID=UPI0033BB4FDF